MSDISLAEVKTLLARLFEQLQVAVTPDHRARLEVTAQELALALKNLEKKLKSLPGGSKIDHERAEELTSLKQIVKNADELLARVPVIFKSIDIT